VALASGTRIGPYEVSAQIGVGGMGEVYRATDTRLKRQVAIKVLPEAVASDAERLARFQREAEVLASLNHANIAIIHGLEKSGDTTALVMELVEGPTLADRIAHGPIPIDEALAIARQIADALEAAHEQGIVHRDLKPANVKVRDDGTVKVLDFGLARAVERAGDVASNVTVSPTITSPAMTQMGVILGTAAYMSPEQAKGRTADRRSDIWAFGAVLYEMLTGRRAFEGEDISDTLAFVIAKEPDWGALPAPTPATIRKLLLRCLQRDRKRRLSDIADARLDIDDALVRPSSDESRASEVDRLRPPGVWQRLVLWTLVVALGSALLVVLALWLPWRAAPSATPLRLLTALGVDASIANDPGSAIALSPDGALLAFVAQETGSPRQLYIRRLEQLGATALSGTRDVVGPFFSPDGAWIAFFAEGKLKKISVTGGAAVTLCDAPNARGGVWAEDGTIVFNPSVATGTGLMRVSSAGGRPEPLATIAEGELTQRWPEILPDGRGVMYTSHTGTVGFDDASLVVQPLPSGPRKVIQRGGYFGRYLRSGHIVYVHERTLFAAPFDLDRLEFSGQALPVLEGVDAISRSGGANFAVSTNGTLVYLQGRGASDERPIDLMDSTGATTPLRTTRANWNNILFAPDGRRVAMDIHDGSQSDVWTYEWAADRPSRLTLDTNLDEEPVWTPDGQRIVFASRRGNKSTFNLYWQRADGSGEVQRLTESSNSQWPFSWHPGGRFLAFTEQTPQNNDDILILSLDGDERSGWKPGKATVFLSSPSRDRQPTFSPDGRWLAYVSNRSGRSEVYVRPFLGSTGEWVISTGGGTTPTWSRTRRELFYGSTDEQIMVVPYTTDGDAFRAEKPRPWSERRYIVASGPAAARSFDLHPDGNRFALAAVPEAQSETKRDTLVFIFNFFDVLRRSASTRQ
jgi:serine/threonine protein kinase/Tol biopolymer transport system component